MSASLPFPTPDIHIEYIQTFPSLHHISCMRDSLLSLSCAAYNADWHAQLGVLPTFCNVSCPVHLWAKLTYWLVPPEIIGWSYTFYTLSLNVSFFIINLYFGLTLLKDSCKKGSGLIGLVPAPSLASLSVVFFHWMPLCPGTYNMITWFTSKSAVSYFIQFVTSSDFVPLTPTAATATC